LVAQNKLISEIQTNLLRCGYSDRLLQTDYFYEDDIGEHTVQLAGFSSSVYDSRTSCISVIDCDDLQEVTDKHVNQFRGLGAPVVFVCYRETVQWWTIGIGGAVFQKLI